jgi:DNA (cytosine-5-)-methyltransferase
MLNNIIDLFSGVGGLSKGFEWEGFSPVLANEIDESIATSYRKNHPGVTVINEDITKLKIEEVFLKYKGVCSVVGGPPCQGFSQKGKRNIIDDPRNYLFKYFFEVVNYVKPKYFVIENVPNILTANKGSFKREIYNIFENIGYTLNSNVLNASDYGVPQNRRRAIIIGKLGYEKVEMPPMCNRTTTVWDAISDLAYLNSGEGEQSSNYIFSPLTDYQRKMRGNSTILYNHQATKHSDIALKRMMLIPVNGNRSDLPKEHLTKSIFSGTWSRINKDELSVTITTRFDTPASGRFMHPFLNRAITVREAARIQSFPDDFVFYGIKTSQMQQVGNAVPPLLAKAIAKVIRKDIERNE